jgi:endonuclease/exonuclease/phosphatase family metal-dependent hydrolase
LIDPLNKNEKEPSRQYAGPSQFTIATYNIRIDVDKAPHRWIDRRDSLIRNIRESNASIIGLQEAQPHSVSYLSAAFPQMRIIGAWRDQTKAEGCPIMFDQSLWTLLEARTYLLGGIRPKPCTTDSCTDGRTCFNKIGCDNYARVMTHMLLRSTVTDGITIDVINTHLPLKQELQEACAKQIIAFADTIQKQRPATTVFIMGDLNTNHNPMEPGTATSVFRQAKFQDSMNWVDQPTYGPMTQQSLKSNMHRLDYILYRNRDDGAMKSMDAHIRNFNVNGARPSDHELCVATFVM